LRNLAATPQAEGGRKEAQTAQKTERFQSGFSQVWFLRLLRFFAAKSAETYFSQRRRQRWPFFCVISCFLWPMAWVLPAKNLEEPIGYLTGGGWPQRGAKGAGSERFDPGFGFCDFCAFLRLNCLGFPE
jgi:hypothetical protein